MNDRPSYHHGALREALIAATEALLAEQGPEAFTLREVARRAGVSPAAPAHHFGDAAGLLTAVASLGFAELTHALREGDTRGGADALAALREQGVEYVAFALRRPGLFRLMFRQGRLREDAELEQHAHAAFEVLAGGVRRAVGVRDAAAMRPAHWQAVTALWSLVHGYAHLAIAGKFDPMCGPGGLEAFVGQGLRPVLQAILGGLFAAPAAARGTRGARSAPSRTGGTR
ncbi:MAG: TetR/AcrR family transcriptional regulator [Rubrivivax sp.]|nr:TetR/AcrR family transcriptional regulator [Rubrivivax sp.]